MQIWYYIHKEYGKYLIITSFFLNLTCLLVWYKSYKLNVTLVLDCDEILYTVNFLTIQYCGTIDRADLMMEPGRRYPNILNDKKCWDGWVSAHLFCCFDYFLIVQVHSTKSTVQQKKLEISLYSKLLY